MTTDVKMKVRQGNCFKLLAACFYEPDKELFLQEGVCDHLAALLTDCRAEEAATAATMMKKALAETGDQELQVEYARLFVGPFELLAPPYGSVYLDGRRALMGNSTQAVRKIYQENGLTLEVMELPDHIALELEFMHYLCIKEAEASDEGNGDLARELAVRQSEFFRKYLAPWMRDFCGNIRQGARNRFYQALADCLESFIVEISPVIEAASSWKRPEDSHACRAAV